jgi:ketosteroid isomerase-like protein
MQSNISQLATQWLAAWNQHDLAAILTHYSESVQFTSPLIIKLLKNPSGTIHGKAALRDYFQIGLNAYPDLKFELIDLLIGVDSLVIYYHSVNSLLAAEFMHLDAEGLVDQVSAHYGKVTA